MRKPGLVFTFERTKCQLLPSLCLSLSSVKHLSATFPKLVTVIYLFSSSLWKLLIKSSLRRKLCHYLDSSDFFFFFCIFWRLWMHERRWWEKDEDHRFSSGDAQRCCALWSPAAFCVTAHADQTCCWGECPGMAGGKRPASPQNDKGGDSPVFSVGKEFSAYPSLHVQCICLPNFSQRVRFWIFNLPG